MSYWPPGRPIFLSNGNEETRKDDNGMDEMMEIIRMMWNDEEDADYAKDAGDVDDADDANDAGEVDDAMMQVMTNEGQRDDEDK